MNVRIVSPHRIFCIELKSEIVTLYESVLCRILTSAGGQMAKSSERKVWACPHNVSVLFVMVFGRFLKEVNL